MTVATVEAPRSVTTPLPKVERPHNGTDVPVRTDTQRFELKYRLDLLTYHRLRCALRPATRHDEFSMRGCNNRYFVRSLYFDTYDYLAYEEKVTGVANRIKCRIRSYWPERDNAAFLKVELKTRVGNLVGKFTERVTLQDYDYFLKRRLWINEPGPVAQEFCRLVLLKDLRPKVLVDYEREALLPLDSSDVRITFDHALRFAIAEDVFPCQAFYQTARPQSIVMEIKTRRDRPRWLERLAETYELTTVPNSKYTWSIEQTQHSLFC